jgi:hypothetical protein
MLGFMVKKNRRGGKKHKHKAIFNGGFVLDKQDMKNEMESFVEDEYLYPIILLNNVNLYPINKQLPNVCWNMILSFVKNEDIYPIVFANKYIYHIAWHRCRDKIEESWNQVAPEICNMKCTHKDANGCNHLCRQERWQLWCPIFHCYHDLAIDYNRCARDCDTLAWYQNDKLIGYNLL